MQKQWLGVLICLALSINTYAQKYSNEFLSIGVSARAQAMAGAQVATVRDVTAGYWNPAGLSGITADMQVAAMHNEWFAGIGRYNYGAFALPLPNQTQSRHLGFSFIRFGVDKIPNTLSLYNADGSIDYGNVTTFNAADYAFMFHYAQSFDSIGLSIGATPKIVHRKIGPFATSWGFGIDIGAQYKIKDWRFGLMLKDITTTFNAWSFNFTDQEKETLGLTGNEIPIKSMEITKPQILIGFGYQKDFKLGKPKEGKRQKYFGLIAEIDFNFTTDGKRNTLVRSNPISMDPVIGLELHYDNLVFLRGGINNIQEFEAINGDKKWAVQPNFGLGFRIYSFYIDYALGLNGGGALLDNAEGAILSHIVSLKVDIDFEYIRKAIKKESL